MIKCYICKYNEQKNKQIERNISDYPLISFEYAYKCNCSNKFAHNKCLKNIKYCPNCKKYNKPNLYVETSWDIYFKSIVNFVQNNLELYQRVKMILSVIAGIFFMLIFNIEIKELNIKIELSIINKIYSFLICQLIIIIISWFNDYMKIYWLYDEATNTIE